MPTKMPSKLNRRLFLGQTAVVAAATIASGYFINPAPAADSKSPNEKLNLAFVGTANKAWDNVEQLASQNVAVLCDVDSNFMGQAAQKYPQARQHRDFRKMLEAEYKNIDAVVVSTADHTHAPATAMALDLGKHVYCEKPLTHTVQEARVVAGLAKKNKLVTQMGTQIHAGDNYRRVVELVQSGAIGPVREVYNWCHKGWSNGRFSETPQPAPANLDWDLWLGPAKERPYSANIHPANWRKFWEYGGGTFGDMACHVMDLPFWALGLTQPTSVECKGPAVDAVGTPDWAMATYEFPAVGDRAAVKFHWADGGENFDLVKQTLDQSGQSLNKWGLGILFVGDKGMIVADYGQRQLLPKDKFADFKAPEPTIPNSIGHWNEWAQACKTGGPTTCNFDYASNLTETVLLGIVAYRSGEKLDWNAEQMAATNTDKAEQYIKKEYRKGWELTGL